MKLTEAELTAAVDAVGDVWGCDVTTREPPWFAMPPIWAYGAEAFLSCDVPGDAVFRGFAADAEVSHSDASKLDIAEMTRVICRSNVPSGPVVATLYCARVYDDQEGKHRARVFLRAIAEP